MTKPTIDPFKRNENTRYRDITSNLRTRFERIIKRAGLKPWPKLVQNLRASRETELMAIYPAKEVASWLKNSVPVAMKDYAMPTDETFRRAVAAGAGVPRKRKKAHDSLRLARPQDDSTVMDLDASDQKTSQMTLREGP